MSPHRARNAPSADSPRSMLALLGRGAEHLEGAAGRVAATGAASRVGRRDTKTIVDCYDLLGLSLLIGIEDYTDGIYHGNQATSYEEAQRNQHDYLLDQLGVGPGFRLLDVGCGTGSLMRRGKERGASVTGITISPRQVDIGRARGLDMRLINYVQLPLYFGAEFDGIVANGSIEHFCQPEQAALGLQDAIYARMFEIFHGLLRTDSPSRKVVTTIIHFRGERVPPEHVMKSPFLPPFDSRAFHFAILQRGFGGYYPEAGQLPGCAAQWFELVAGQDGTRDYDLTSEDWLRRLRHALRHSARFRRGLVHFLMRRPRHTLWFLLSLTVAQSWPWQFRSRRGQPSPTILLRHTWRAR